MRGGWGKRAGGLKAVLPGRQSHHRAELPALKGFGAIGFEFGNFLAFGFGQHIEVGGKVR